MKNKKTEQQTNALQQSYNEWYESKIAHWEDAPGKSVIIDAMKICCNNTGSKRILDIACGTGTFLVRIQEEVFEKWEYYGVDFSLSAIESARNQYSNMNFECADATNLSYEDNFFDVVTCYGSWEHFADPQAAILEASRVLKPNGWLFAMMPTLSIHRTDRHDEGWYEDVEVEGYTYRQKQWNLWRSTWEKMFDKAGVQMMTDSLAIDCGAIKPGVFYFGVKLANNNMRYSEDRFQADKVAESFPSPNQINSQDVV